MRPILAALLVISSLQAQTPAPTAKPAPKPTRAPTAANVAYGTHERQVLDFYKAESAKPTPLLFFIHGGGWVAGDKARPGSLEECLAAGISVVSINYRYSWQAQREGVMPPVKWPLEDAARALQFVRSRAGEWNIDKQRIGASGGSAGACSSLYLAFHDDMADPKSSDLIARESTRLWCAAVSGAQTSLDPKQLNATLSMGAAAGASSITPACVGPRPRRYCVVMTSGRSRARAARDAVTWRCRRYGTRSSPKRMPSPPASAPSSVGSRCRFTTVSVPSRSCASTKKPRPCVRRLVRRTSI